ncbi:MAG: tetraacyldisaccharide 4'-kinase, partial [Flavobacteriales bacterium]
RRTASGFQWVSDAASWHEVGDEPWMIQRQLPELDVAVGADRIAALSRMAQERPSLRVVVLDDGLQHRALKPDRAVVLTSRLRPPQGFGWSRLLPAGPWRDLPSRLGKADVVVATTPVAASQPHDLATSPTTRVPQLDRPVLLVTGIAQPHRVIEAALRHGIELAGTAHYRDHHAFTERDVAAWASWMRSNDVTHMLTTAKDAVRMEMWTASWTDLQVAVLELEVEWHAVEEIDAFLKTWTQSLPS